MKLYVALFGNSRVKIGVSSNVQKRIASIATAGDLGQPLKLSEFDFSNARCIEQQILTIMKNYKSSGEWLNCSFDDVISMVNNLSDHGNENLQFDSLSCSVDNFFKASFSSLSSGNMVNLTQLFYIGNKIRLDEKQPSYQLSAFLNSKGLSEYIEAVRDEWNLPTTELIIKPNKGTGCTLAHISIACFASELISPKIHAKMHKMLINGMSEKYYATGGTEFQSLNASMSSTFKDDDMDEFYDVANVFRARILGVDAKTEDWNHASVEQTHLRYEWENKLCDMLRLGVVQNYEHLKTLINRM